MLLPVMVGIVVIMILMLMFSPDMMVMTISKLRTKYQHVEAFFLHL